MIGWLHGRLVAKRPPSLLLDVGGVGYELQAPMTTFYGLPDTGEACTFFTHMVVREDAQHLFGFGAEHDRDVFRLLLRVNGVGPKVALAILSGMDTRQLATTVEHSDTVALSRVPGIGRKTAERILVDLRDRLPELDGLPTLSGGPANAPVASAVTADPVSEAVAALVALGFKPPEASKRVRDVAEDGFSCEEIVRKALQGAAP
ncbi:MAG: Holliday junction branch migration protein RuvA [Pseudomonadota bacterium]